MNLRRFVLALTVVTAGGLAWFLSLALGHRPVPRQQPNVAKVGFQVGERAPDFELRSLNGVDLRLSNLQGRPVLLNFWATWCATVPG
jgi:cytochrome oxidase Cu insertion factor (SCO1/SenC/PrrC family)